MTGPARHRRDVLAVVPAAGTASRLGPLPTSKEVLTVRRPGDGGTRLACQDLLEACDLARVPAALLVTRRSKLDIPTAVADLPLRTTRVATLIVPRTPSPVHTLAAAADFARHRRVVVGFPDILLRPLDCLDRLLALQESTGADIALALFPPHDPDRSDTVELGPEGRVRRIAVKEPGTGLDHVWMLAVWTPPVTERLVATSRRRTATELHVGHVLQEAINDGLRVRALALADGEAVDLGTPEALAPYRAPRSGSGHGPC